MAESGPRPTCFLQIVPETAGGRTDQVLATHPEVPSRVTAQRLIANGHVRLNGSVLGSASRRLHAGDQLDWTPRPPEPLELIPEPGPLEILPEDAHLIVLNKPPGLVVHPAPGHATGTLVHRLLYYCPNLSGIGGVRRPGIVHRLDKDTSGVLVVAKTDPAHQHLARQFQEHSVKRQYQTLVWGKPKAEQGTVDAPLGRHPTRRKDMVVIEGGRRAVTHWKVLKRFAGTTLLACRLETGRTHQIRAHLASLGLSVVGDPQYGRSPLRRLGKLSSHARTALSGFQRQALHAERLGFIHPESGECLMFRTEPPDDFQALVTVLESKGTFDNLALT